MMPWLASWWSTEVLLDLHAAPSQSVMTTCFDYQQFVCARTHVLRNLGPLQEFFYKLFTV